MILYNILGWYSLILILIGTLLNMFSNKETPRYRFLVFIFQIPLLYFLYLALIK